MPGRGTERWKAPAEPHEPCPCGRGVAFADCCDVPGRLPVLRLKNLRPPGARTGHSNANCPRQSTGDCSERISGEHYISAAILAEFGELRTTGLPFFGPGETRVG